MTKHAFRTPLPIADADEIRALAERAFALLRPRPEPEEDDEDDRWEQRRADVRTAVQALRFCANAAGMLEDPALLPLFPRALAERAVFDDFFEDSNMEVMAAGVTALLAAGAPVDSTVRALAKDTDPRFRRAVAAGLAPKDAAAIALLHALSADPVAEVREAAREALGPEHEVPWWNGKFTLDPIPRLTLDEAARLKDALPRIAAIVDGGRDEIVEHAAELTELARALPDSLAVELSESVLSAADERGPLELPDLGAAMLARPGGLAALERVIARWVENDVYVHGLSALATAMIRRLPLPGRRSACAALLARAVGASDDERCEDMFCAASITASAVAHAWPAAEDPSPVLDALLALPEPPRDKSDYVAGALTHVLERSDIDPAPLLERAIEARLAGYRGPYSSIRWTLDKLLDRAPDAVLRPVAEQALSSDDDATITWGLKLLLGRLHDKARDGSPAAMVRRLFSDPRCRRAFAADSDLAQRAFPLLRAELRTGRLAWWAAHAAMLAIVGLYGGNARHGFFKRRELWPGREQEIEAQKRERMKQLRPFLGPKRLQGPPTEEEWRCFRVARERHPFQGYTAWREALELLPEGPWAPEDRAFIDRALQAMRAGERAIDLPIGLALLAKPDPADLPILDELVSFSAEDPDLPKCRRLLRERLGLPELAGDAAGEDDDDW